MSSSAKQKILCIEDNPVNWRLVQRLLTQAGFEMHWAEEGLKGYEMALELRPDLVLLDINLPGLSGFEVATKFRQSEELKATTIVALTAKTLKTDRETALVAGCDGFIPKPIDPFNFVKQVSAYLEGQRDRIEEAREGAVLRLFNVQMLEHLELQLKEAHEANTKLRQAQQDLELRNRSLSHLVTLSQEILVEHDPATLFKRVLEHARGECAARDLLAYRLHSSQGYWEGLRWNDRAFEGAPVLPMDHPFPTRLRILSPASIQGGLYGDKLRASRLWEEGLSLGAWNHGSEVALIALRDRQNEEELCGFWIFVRDAGEPFQPAELEMMALGASLALVCMENAELIVSLNESTRALASSYERMEGAYQDLQRAQAALHQKERQGVLEELFVKISQRLEEPVACLHRQSEALEEGLGPGSPQTASVHALREAVGTIDGLLKALLRRVGKDLPALPEWVDLHVLIQQELELLQAEGLIPPGVRVRLALGAASPSIYGVYADFAKVLQNLIQHAVGAPLGTPTLRLRSWVDGEDFHLEILDEGGPIVPQLMDSAFEPFSQLHQEAVTGVRSPGQGLPIAKQLLASYHGEAGIRNAGEGTALHVHFPLH